MKNEQFLNHVLHGDCLEWMPQIEDSSIDMILCDLPYGTTACKWDTIIPFEMLWEQYERIIKDDGAIVLTASQPFTSALVMSKPKLFKYEWIWEKNKASNFLNSKFQPLKAHESILIFSKKASSYSKKGSMLYFPQKEKGEPYKSYTGYNKSYRYHSSPGGKEIINETGERHPKSIIKINVEQTGLHPTQKPVALFEYLIQTYTREGMTILDNCIGSGTTAIATINVGGNRNFIGIEKEWEYCEIAKNRIEAAKNQN